MSRRPETACDRVLRTWQSRPAREETPTNGSRPTFAPSGPAFRPDAPEGAASRPGPSRTLSSPGWQDADDQLIFFLLQHATGSYPRMNWSVRRPVEAGSAGLSG